MNSRREFLQELAAATFATGAVMNDHSSIAGSAELNQGQELPQTGSDIGSLYPFVQSQAVHGEFPLSYLRPEFRDARAWKKKGRAKVLELLHYSPPKCDPRADVLGRIDRGDYFEENIRFIENDRGEGYRFVASGSETFQTPAGRSG